LALAVMSVGMGILVGVWIRRVRLAAMVGLNLAIYLFFLGGGFSTVQFLPGWIQVASRLVPTSYAISGLRQTLFYPDLINFGRDLFVVALTALLVTVLSALALTRAWRRA
jgi:ABC-type multidrug transport system permease subunit